MDKVERARIRAKLWIANNRERKREHDRNRYAKFKAEGRLDEYYGNTNRERNRNRSRMWRQINQGRVNATLAKRRADLLQATPRWAEYDEIVKVYDEARMLTETSGTDYEVDHIIPLNSSLVCGLHCMDNLQIMTASANNRKKCKLLEV